MEVLFFTEFSKRKNSTKQPNDEEGILKNVVLKDNTDKTNPTFFLSGTEEYVYCKAWGMYYFIHRIGYGIDGAQILYCNIDVLATWKSEIQATSAFIEYSSSDYSALLIDERVAMLTDIDDIVLDTTPSMFTTTPSYILTVIGENGVTCLLPRDPNKTQADLYQASVADLVSALCIQWGDAQDCLLSLREVPLAVGADYNVQDVKIGKYSLGYSEVAMGQYGNSNLYEDTAVLHIPETYSDFRRFTFTTMRLYLPMMGVVELDMRDFASDPTALNRQVVVHAVANPLTGHLAYEIKNDEGDVIAIYTGSFGRELPLNASVPRDTIGAISHMLSGISKIETSPTSAIANITKGISDALQFKGSVVGTFAGGFGEHLGTNYVLSVQKHLSRIEPSSLTALYGRPCGKVRSIAGLTGYVKTSGFNIEISSLDAHKQMINSLMDEGVYLE